MKKALCLLAVLVALAGCDITNRYELGSLFNYREVSGSFFLGSGYVGEVEYLFAWGRKVVEQGNAIVPGAWIRIRADVRECRVFLDEDDSPYLVTYPNRFVNKYEFHVPIKTIIRKFELK